MPSRLSDRPRSPRSPLPSGGLRSGAVEAAGGGRNAAYRRLAAEVFSAANLDNAAVRADLKRPQYPVVNHAAVSPFASQSTTRRTTQRGDVNFCELTAEKSTGRQTGHDTAGQPTSDRSKETAMHPTAGRHVMNARVEDMHREAADDGLARAARRARRAHADHGTMWLPGRLATVLARMRAWSGVHRLRSASSQPEQASRPGELPEPGSPGRAMIHNRIPEH